MAREHDDFDHGKLAFDLNQGGVAIHSGHLDVQNDHLDIGPPQNLQCRAPLDAVMTS